MVRGPLSTAVTRSFVILTRAVWWALKPDCKGSKSSWCDICCGHCSFQDFTYLAFSV